MAAPFSISAYGVDTAMPETTLARSSIDAPLLFSSIMAAKRKTDGRKGIRRSKRSTSDRRLVSARQKKTPGYVYYFGDGHADGAGNMKPLLGGKGANLHEMTRIGLPVPPGFTITTEVCSYFYDHKRTYPPQLKGQVAVALARVEKSNGKRLADKGRPLFIHVRWAGRDCIRVIQDTVLSVG